MTPYGFYYHTLSCSLFISLFCLFILLVKMWQHYAVLFINEFALKQILTRSQLYSVKEFIVSEIMIYMLRISHITVLSLSSSPSSWQYIRGGLPLPPVWLVSYHPLLARPCLYMQLHNSLALLYFSPTPQTQLSPPTPSTSISWQFPLVSMVTVWEGVGLGEGGCRRKKEMN